MVVVWFKSVTLIGISIGHCVWVCVVCGVCVCVCVRERVSE